ncbi:hypothetical protein ABT369_26770 [Dactylosporangium sp. NPDC000244]|uniref:hypothetical protein n=1 Tax=Dactylosporangium sp. NPDC000244 TaxID=3154365 RepID=UPI0033202375
MPVLGGAGAATASARAGRAGIQRLGDFLTDIGTGDLGSALRDAGLERLVGQDRFDVLDELITYIAGDGSDADSQAARDAACDVIDDVFGDADSWDDLHATAISAEDLPRLLEAFLARYIYNRMPVVAERLSRLFDPQAAQQADADMRAIIEDMVAIAMPTDPFNVDWSGPQGRQIADDALRRAYEAFEGWDGDES